MRRLWIAASRNPRAASCADVALARGSSHALLLFARWLVAWHLVLCRTRHFFCSTTVLCFLRVSCDRVTLPYKVALTWSLWVPGTLARTTAQNSSAFSRVPPGLVATPTAYAGTGAVALHGSHPAPMRRAHPVGKTRAPLTHGTSQQRRLPVRDTCAAPGTRQVPASGGANPYHVVARASTVDPEPSPAPRAATR